MLKTFWAMKSTVKKKKLIKYILGAKIPRAVLINS